MAFPYVVGDSKAYRATLQRTTDAGVVAVDLAGATVALSLVSQESGRRVTATADVVTAASGIVEATLEPSLGLLAGSWRAEWVVTFADAAERTFPETSSDVIQVRTRA